MVHQYEPLPTDSLPGAGTLGPARRRRSSRVKIRLHDLARIFRPVHVLYLLPTATLILILVDVARHGSSAFWSRLSQSHLRSDTELRYKDGLAYVDMAHLGRGRQHPLVALIQRGKQKAEAMESRIKLVNGVEDAVKDYKRAFGMLPPEGFEQWYDFATSHNSTALPSLIPFAHTSVLPYLALPPTLLQSRAIEMQQERGVFGMTFQPDSVNASERIMYGNEDDVVGYMSPRWDYPLLLEPIAHLLPPNQQSDRPVQISACVKDGSCRLSHGDLMERSRELARAGYVWDEDDLVKLEDDYRYNDQLGWLQTCPPGSLASDVTPPSAAGGSASFVDDSLEYMDFCKHPKLVKLNGEMIMEDQHLMRPLAPMLAVSRLSHGADMVGVPTRAVNDTHDFEPWIGKNRSQAVWRGTITGVFHRERWNWRASQRDRLAKLTATGQDEQRDAQEVAVLVESEQGTQRATYRQGDMVDQWMDVGVVNNDIDNLCGVGPLGEACRLDGKHDVECMIDHACDEMKEEIQFKGSMTNVEALPYKYRLDIDGYGWSSRFRKVLSSNTVIIKSTVYPEWWSAQAIPWYHFVPMKYDYSDVFDIMSFFDGAPDGSTPAELREERDKMAQVIAANGRKFSLERLRWVDMQSYMFLFYLEYRRAWSLDREAASYRE